MPVIAASGITYGRAIAAAFAPGASGVQIGTAFLWLSGSRNLTLTAKRFIRRPTKTRG